MLRTSINIRLNDQYLQSWYTYIDISSKASSYKSLKNTSIFRTQLSHLVRKNTGVHYYVLNFQTIIFIFETGRWKNVLGYYVHYVAIVVSEMNFITFLPVCTLRTR